MKSKLVLGTYRERRHRKELDDAPLQDLEVVQPPTNMKPISTDNTRAKFKAKALEIGVGTAKAKDRSSEEDK